MKVLITAGPTREPIDPVRFLSNRSSGKMGYALAAESADRGHETVLVSGPVALPEPDNVRTFKIETAKEMYDTVAQHTNAQVAIFAAAVADYRPVEFQDQKIKKSDETLVLKLERTPDILGSMRTPLGFSGFLVGFAAETEELRQNARNKLEKKACDLLIGNDVSRSDIGFDQDENEIILFFKDGRQQPVPKDQKSQLAKTIFETIEHELNT